MVLLQLYFHASNLSVSMSRNFFKYGLRTKLHLQTKWTGISLAPKRNISNMHHCCRKKFNKLKETCSSIRSIHISQRRLIPPWFMIIFKFKGLKILKWVSIIAGRSARIYHNKLPAHLQQQISRHKVAWFSFMILALIILFFSYKHYDLCPLTNRRRWISFTRKQILLLADTDHRKLLEMYQDKFVDQNSALCQIANSLVKALIEHNSDIDQVKNINWNLNVVKDDDINNAFVLPNGEIYLFTGMMQLINSWEELAIVLSHEMAHSVLGHSQEQQSFLVFGELLFIPFLAFLWYWFEDFTAFLAWTVQDYLYSKIFEVVFNLPYSRQLETEADVVGLNMAAKACFDPRWGVLLWDKMAFKEAVDDLLKGETTEIKFLSSHPSHDKRATVLEDNIPALLTMRTEHGCSKLPSNKNPLSDAHKLRKFTINVRKRVALIEEIKLLQSNESKNDSNDESLLKLLKEYQELTFQYQAMLEKENIKVQFDTNLPKKDTVQKYQPSQFKSILNIWSSLIGKQLSIEFSKNSGNTVGDHSSGSKMLKQKRSRSYYDNAYF